MLETTYPDNALISKSYQSFESMFNIFNLLNDDASTFTALKEKLKSRKLLSKFKNFYQIQSNYANDVELVWGDVFQNDYKISLKKERISYVANILTKYENAGEEIRVINCIIKGISLRHKKVELYCNGRYKDAKADDKALFHLANRLNNNMALQVKVFRKINESTDEIEEFWEIV